MRKRLRVHLIWQFQNLNESFWKTSTNDSYLCSRSWIKWAKNERVSRQDNVARRWVWMPSYKSLSPKVCIAPSQLSTDTDSLILSAYASWTRQQEVAQWKNTLSICVIGYRDIIQTSSLIVFLKSIVFFSLFRIIDISSLIFSW